ncbi:MAG: hypothetical protein ACHQIM_22030 [Sphingobacteriales bacterium]
MMTSVKKVKANQVMPQMNMHVKQALAVGHLAKTLLIGVFRNV